MPTKIRTETTKARELEKAAIPEYIQKRIQARREGNQPKSKLFRAILDSGPHITNLPSHLLSFDGTSGEPFSLGASGGDHVSHRTAHRIKILKDAYPRHWLELHGAGAIALAEKNKPITDRVIKTEPAVSKRTVERYFALCRSQSCAA